MDFLYSLKDNVHIILTKDSKKSKVSGLCIATNYDISVSQVLSVNIYSMFILKHLDEDLFADKSMHEQISDAIDIILNHEKEEITLIIDDYLYNIESKKNKWFKIIILPRTDVNQL